MGASEDVLPWRDLVGQDDLLGARGPAVDVVPGSVARQVLGAEQVLVKVKGKVVAGCSVPGETVDVERPAVPGQYVPPTPSGRNVMSIASMAPR